MIRKIGIRTLAILLWAGMVQTGARAQRPDLTTAPSDQLLKVYAQLRSLQGSEVGAVTENVVWKRDAATFTFIDGRISFAAPVEGHVVAAAFEGRGTIVMDPPTQIDQNQIARFTKSPRLEDGFRSAIFFFTDDSWDDLQKLVNVRSSGPTAGDGAAIGEAETRLQKNFNNWWESRAKGGFPISNLAARMLADLTDPTSRGFFLADVQSEHHDELFYSISWNRDVILNTGFSTDEEVMLMHHKRGQYSEWWSGFHLAGEYATTPHPEHRTLLAHCSEEHIDAVVSKDNHLSASVLMQFEVPMAKARLLPLNLAGVLRISGVTDEAGKKISFIQEDRKLDSDPWIILPEPASAGTQYKLKISYDEDSTRESRIIDQEGSGLYFVGARTSWYPSFGAFDDRTHFFLHFESPKNHDFVATGRNLTSEKKGKELETSWESEIPYSVVGFNYGDFVQKSQKGNDLTVTVYAGKDIPDELKGLSQAIDMADLAQGPGGSHNIEGELGIMRGGFNTTGMASSAAAISYSAFRLFEYYYGLLPFKTISVSEQPVRGFAQSWPTLIFLSYDSLLDDTTRHSLHLQDSAEGREFFNTVAVHEMSHQWWGHMVGWKTYHDQWLSEGFADFSAALYLHKSDPKRFKGFWDLKRVHLLSNNGSGHAPVEAGPLWMNYQSNAYLEGRNSTFLIYEKGAYVLEMLRILMEEPNAKEPDARFIAMMRDFVTTYAGKNASTGEFKSIVDKHFQENMDWFFNEWVYGEEIPHYDFSYNLTSGNNGQTVLHFALRQSNVSDSFLMRVPLYATVAGTNHRLGFIVVKGSTTVARDVPLPFRPEKISLDDTHSILCTMKQ
ncbi:MAG TPA: M1 family aminopeptidase [Terriglobia bacterium]|nr:M1 family aminopeptidase [Terriglobia bacterium]